MSSIKFRKATVGDANFVLNSWLRSYRSSPFARTMTNTVFYEGHHPVIRSLIKRSECIVACNFEDEDQIYGYIVHEKLEDDITAVHYCYVKQPFRGMGICKALILSAKSEAAGIYTHHTKAADKIAQKYNLIHHPYYAFSKSKEDQ